MEKRTEKKQILLIDMYGVIIKESKGYFIPYTFEHFDRKEKELRKLIGSRAKQRRVVLGLNQPDVAEKMGWPLPQSCVMGQEQSTTQRSWSWKVFQRHFMYL